MPLRRCIAPVSSSVFTARSIETSPQITSLTLLPEPPKSSPTVPLNDAPDLLPQAILTKMYTPERMPRTGDGCNILYLERGDTIHIEEVQALQGESVTLRPPRESDVDVVYSWDRDPELAAWNGRSPISISLSAARRDYLARWEDPSVKTFIIEARGEPIGMATLYDFRRDGCELGIKIGPGIPSRQRLRHRSRDSPHRLRLPHPGPRGSPRLDPGPQRPHAKGLREERLCAGR